MNFYNKKYIWLLFSIVLITLMSCEEEITLDMPTGEQKIVIEGYIEPEAPPYILLTHTIPYFSQDFTNEISDIFISGAEISIFNGTKTVDLMEINISDLPDSIAKFLLDEFQLSVENIKNSNLVFYTSITMMGEVGKEYTLNVKTGNKTIEAKTTIPQKISFDSIWVEPHPNPQMDSLFLIKAKYKDPPNESNYYRYFTKRNDEPFYPNRFYSVTDDELIDGQTATFAFIRGESKYKEFNPRDYGFFKSGDTVVIKFCTIDKKHFDFWNTYSAGQFAGGPFMSPVEIISNVDGGLGIFGGYGATYTEFIIP